MNAPTELREAIAAWTPEGFIGQMFATTRRKIIDGHHAVTALEQHFDHV